MAAGDRERRERAPAAARLDEGGDAFEAVADRRRARAGDEDRDVGVDQGGEQAARRAAVVRGMDEAGGLRGVAPGEGEARELPARVHRDRAEGEEAVARCDAAGAERDRECGRRRLVEGVGRDELDPVVQGVGLEPGAPGVAPRGDRLDRHDLVLGEVHERLEHRPLVVAAATMAEVDQDAAARGERALVVRIGDGGADRPVAQEPVADTGLCVGSADGVLGEARGREPTGGELGPRSGCEGRREHERERA